MPQPTSDKIDGVLLSSLNNPGGFVASNNNTTLPSTAKYPQQPIMIPNKTKSAMDGRNTSNSGNTITSPASISTGGHLPLTTPVPRPTRLSKMDLLDSSITGSTDLSGEKKTRIDHTRVEDSSLLESKYVTGRKLGQGSFGTVRLGVDKVTGITWAIKSIKKTRGSTEQLEQLAREVAIMKRVKHPHIVQLKEVHETPSKIYLVMEFCKGGELVRRVAQKRYCSEYDCRIIMRRLLEAVAYLHDHGVVHRDLKPENVLLSTDDPNDNLNIKVSDFGLATFSGACKMMENMCGTPFYMAPEIVANLGYSHQCDVWSLGVMLYLLLCGYRRECEHALQRMIAYKKIEFTDCMPDEVSPAAKDLILRMLQFDPAERITAREALQHPWANGEVEAPEALGQTTVLQMMKSYNAERRLKRLINVVLASVRFQRGGSYGATVDDSEDTSSSGESDEESTGLRAATINLSVDEERDQVENDSLESIPSSLEANTNATINPVTAASVSQPLVVAPTNTNRPKRTITSSRVRLDSNRGGVKMLSPSSASSSEKGTTPQRIMRGFSSGTKPVLRSSEEVSDRKKSGGIRRGNSEDVGSDGSTASYTSTTSSRRNSIAVLTASQSSRKKLSTLPPSSQPAKNKKKSTASSATTISSDAYSASSKNTTASSSNIGAHRKSGGLSVNSPTVRRLSGDSPVVEPILDRRTSRGREA